MPTTNESLKSVQAELDAARNLREANAAKAAEAKAKVESFAAKKASLGEQLAALTSRFANLASLTSELKERVQKRRADAETQESNLAAAESRMGLAGIEAANTVRPENTSQPAYDSLAATYSALKSQERAGEVAKGAAQAFYAKHRAILNPRRSTTAQSPPAPAEWGEKIVRGSGD